VDISQLHFSAVHVSFSDDRPDLTLYADESGSAESFVDLGIINDEEVTKSTKALIWTSGQRIVMIGSLHSDVEGDTKVCTRMTIDNVADIRLNQSNSI